MIVSGTFDWFTFIFFTNEFGIRVDEHVTIGINFLPAVFVFAADLIYAFVTKTSVSSTEIGFAIKVGSTLNIDTFVTVGVSSADLLVTTVFSISTFNIDTCVIATC